MLEELAASYNLPRVVLEYRALAKLKSTYTDTLPEQINPHTGRVHTCYHQAVAATGRLSSMEPNLQNIPIRTPEGRRIRQAFVAPPGWCIVAADYSQIELRIMAHLSGDAGLLNAFAEERDIHQATAAEVFGMALEQVSASSASSMVSQPLGRSGTIARNADSRRRSIRTGSRSHASARYHATGPGASVTKRVRRVVLPEPAGATMSVRR